MLQEPHQHPVVEKKELRAWLLYDWANGPIFYSAITFLPLIITTQAKERAKVEFCGACDNYEWAVDFETHGSCDDSTFSTNRSCVDGGHEWDADLKDEAKLVPFLFGSSVGFASFPQYCTIASVALQLLLYISMGSFADYGANRKRFLIGNTWIGIALLCMTLLTGSDSLYWLNGLIYISVSVAFNFAVLFYNAYLPLLVNASPVVREARAKHETAHAIGEISRHLTHIISLEGLATGFTGQLIFLIGNVAILSLISDANTLNLRISTMTAGAWVAVFASVTFRYLKIRPGPSLPAGQTYCAHSMQSASRTFKSFTRLTQLRKFLVAYFVFSDGAQSLGSAALIFGQEQLNMSATMLGVALIEVTLLGILGCVFFKWLHESRKWRSKDILVLNLLFLGLIPLYGLLALTHTWEFYLAAAVFGFNTASQQAFTRSIFAHHIPRGREAEYFAFYEISDKGTAWLGPLLLGIVFQVTGSYRSAFSTLVAFFVVGTLLLLPFDSPTAEQERDKFEAEDIGLSEAVPILDHISSSAVSPFII